jgi:predicted PurR-regulated permease PerM
VKPLKTGLAIVLSCLVAAPVAVVAAFLMSPFWSWFEKKTGVESIGHSGPANWCFLATYLLILSLTLMIVVWLRGFDDRGQ